MAARLGGMTADEERFYERRWERTGWDPLGLYRDRPCHFTGHVEGCPGLAGGDHELKPGWIAIGDPDDGYVVEVEIAP